MEQNVNQLKNRDYWFDNVKGFLMITVVVGHLIASVLNKFPDFVFLSNFIYSFHMPAFAIISGFFMKRRVDNKDYSSVINKIIVPYLIAQIFIYVVGMVLPDGVKALSLERFAESGVFTFTVPIYHLWYFVGMIIAFFYCVSSNAKNHPVRAMVIASVISLVSGFLPSITFLKLTKIAGFLPFFVLGYVLPKDKMYLLKNKKRYFAPSIVVFLVVIAVFWFLKDEGTLTGIFAMTSRYGKFGFSFLSVVDMLIRFGYIVASIVMTFSLMGLSPCKKTPLSKLGERSVYIYVLHVIIVAVIRHFNYETHFLSEMQTPWLRALYVLFGVLICFVLVSKPVIKAFKPLLEPDFDIRNVIKYISQ